MTPDAARDAIENAMPMREYSPDDDETLTVIPLTSTTYLAVVITPPDELESITVVCNYLATFHDDDVSIERIYLTHLVNR